jgi:hypothetical protein
MGGTYSADDDKDYEEKFKASGYVAESVVTDEIREDFAKLGWHPSPWPKDDK